MSVDAVGPRSRGVVERVRAVVRGKGDDRVRATWRVLLAMPVFWTLAGGLAGTVQAVVEPIPTGSDPFGGLAGSLLHGGLVVVALVGWARYLDRRPLSDYGVSASRSWLADLLVGFGAVVVAFGAWFGVGSVLGWATVEVAASAPRGSLALQLATFVLALGIHVWIQQLVFFRIVVGSAAEGLHSRGVAPRRAVAVGLLVALPIFVGMHELTGLLRLVDLAIAGAVFGLLYAHTGELAVPIGVHLGVFVCGGVLFASAGAAPDALSILQVTQSLPGPIATIGGYGFPKLVVAYGLLVASLAWRRDGALFETDVARWTER